MQFFWFMLVLHTLLTHLLWWSHSIHYQHNHINKTSHKSHEKSFEKLLFSSFDRKCSASLAKMSMPIYAQFLILTLKCTIFSFLTSIYGRESIVLASDFRNCGFNKLTCFKIPWIQKSLFNGWCGVCFCYQHNSETNYSRNSKFVIQHLCHA